MKTLILVALILGFVTIASAAEKKSKLGELNCKGTLDLDKSFTTEKIYYEQDKERYGIDGIRFTAFSDAGEYVLADRQTSAMIESVNPAGETMTLFPDPGGASSKESTIKVVRTYVMADFDYAAVWSTPGPTKVSVSYFASASHSKKGFLELILTSGALRRYYYDLDCGAIK